MPILAPSFLAALADPATVVAYVNPTIGGLIMQLLLAGAGGLYVVLRMKGRRIFRSIRRPRPDA